MPVVFVEALARQLGRRRGEDGLAESLDAELSNESQTRGCEEHFLAHGGGVRDVGYGDEGRCVVGDVAAEDDVEGCIGLEMWLQEGQIIAKGGRGGGEDGQGDEGFGGYGTEEAKLIGGRDESLESGEEFLGGWGKGMRSAGCREAEERTVPDIPDCILEEVRLSNTMNIQFQV